MENRIRNFVYCNDSNYTSYDSIKYLLFCICFFLTLIVGVFAIVTELWLFLSIIIAIDCTFLLHSILLKIFFKNTYRLRFLSDGIIDVLLSSLFLTSAYIVLFATECNTDFITYGTLISYALFVILYVSFIIVDSKSNKYQSLQQSVSSKKRFLLIGLLIPVSGTIGMMVARIIFGVFDLDNQVAVYVVFVLFTVISLFFSLGYSNFIKYFYCIKYKIICDQFGDETSPKLKRQHKSQDKKTRKKATPKIPLIVKILMIIVCIPIVFFAILFIVFFIRSITMNV